MLLDVPLVRHANIAKHHIGGLLLVRRESSIERLKSRSQILHVLRMLHGELCVRISYSRWHSSS